MVAVTDDVDVKVDAKTGKVRATITSWAAGIAAIIAATGAALYVVSQAVFAIIALFLNYEDVGFGDARARHTRPGIERQQAKEKDPKKEERQVADPGKPIEEKLRGNPRTKITDKTVPEEKHKIGRPLDITPKVVDGGEVPMIAPVQQGDEQEDSPDKPPRGSFEENGRWYQIIPYKCESLGDVPMPYEACSASPKSPGGRPTIRQ